MRNLIEPGSGGASKASRRGKCFWPRGGGGEGNPRRRAVGRQLMMSPVLSARSLCPNTRSTKSHPYAPTRYYRTRTVLP